MIDDNLTLVSTKRLRELLALEKSLIQCIHFDKDALVRKMIEEGAIKVELRLASLPPKQRHAPKRTKKIIPEGA